MDVEFTSSLGLPDTDPVCCAVTGSLESLLFHEGFHQDGSVGIKHLPIGGYLGGQKAEDT